MKKLFASVGFMLAMVFPSVQAADYGLPSGIQEGNILHCFNWTISDVKAELPNIAAAGFGSVQLSPLQRSDARVGSEWHNLYRPYDLAFKGGLGTEAELKALCEEAADYGIKVIVDVVANHVDKTAGYHDKWWDESGRVRWNGSINYGDRYSITHGQLGDYGDVNSEDAEVQARAKAYVEKLKECGVKGIRWDAAKHIGLPSEGCNFWSTVTSVSGMWHYGEILDNPGPDANIIKEYAKYMSFTDNQYCNYAARDNGGLPTGYGGNWAVNYSLGNKCVYWGESHDTYSNDEWSKDRDQATIDRAYAAYACRNAETALYLSRPNTKGFSNIKVGKGSTHFKEKQIAMVNKFRNAMVGRKDYFTNNGNAVSITRENGGAVIVMKGSGNVSIANGGGYCPVGTYTDLVSGGTFTVTASTISGVVGASGIAVIMKDGVTPDPTPDPTPGSVTISGDYNLAYIGNKVNVYYWGGTSNATWPGVEMQSATGSDGKVYKVAKVPEGTKNVIFNTNGNVDQTSDLVYSGTFVMGDTGATTTAVTFGSNPTPDPDPEPTTASYCYFNNTAGWNVKVWAWNDGGNCTVASSWPGDSMTEKDGKLYWEAPQGKTPTMIIFSNNGGEKAGGGDLQFVNGATYNVDGTYSVTTDPDPDPTPDPDPDPTPDPTPVTGDNLITDYYKVNPNGCTGSNRTVTMTFDGMKSTSALTNWSEADLIAQGVARDVAQAFKGHHERPIVDSYAIYAAYDKDNLYLGVQFVYTVWDLYGEGKQPGESKPYNMDGHMCIAFDLDRSKSFDGYINGTGPIWNETMKGAKFANGVDAVFMTSTKPGVGTPGFFIPTPDGHASYDAAYCKTFTGKYGYADGLLPSIEHVWGQESLDATTDALKTNEGFVDLRSEIDDSAHTFYEFKFPLSLLGVTEDYIKTNGIGVMYLDKYGTSPVGGTPYDPSYFDNVSGSYSLDSSSSKEKEDEDVITYLPAWIGKRVVTAVEDIAVDSNEDATVEYFNLQGVRVDNPSNGIFIMRQGNTVRKVALK